MKISNTQEVLESNIQNTKGFQIKASRKAFDILSDGLYSDKVGSVIRELICNMHDAHVVAKQKKPYEVNFLSGFESSQIEFKDHGTGLSEDQVYGIYTTYFDSDKSESNDCIGGFGLGSKSPFSLVDSYTVISRQNGVAKTYLMYKGDTGPEVSKISEEPTDEDNGLTIRLEVESFYDWKHKFKNFVDNCSDVINIKTNDETMSFLTPEKIADHLFMNSNNQQRYYNNQFMIRIGLAVYRVDIDKVYNQEKQRLDYQKRNFLEHLMVEVPVGYLIPTASREELSIDDESNKKIYELAEKAIHDYAKTLKDIAEDGKTDLDKFSIISQFLYNRRQPIEIFDLTDFGLKYPQAVDYCFDTYMSRIPVTPGVTLMDLLKKENFYNQNGHKVGVPMVISSTPRFAKAKIQAQLGTENYIRLVIKDLTVLNHFPEELKTFICYQKDLIRDYNKEHPIYRTNTSRDKDAPDCCTSDSLNSVCEYYFKGLNRNEKLSDVEVTTKIVYFNTEDELTRNRLKELWDDLNSREALVDSVVCPKFMEGVVFVRGGNSKLERMQKKYKNIQLFVDFLKEASVKQISRMSFFESLNDISSSLNRMHFNKVKHELVEKLYKFVNAGFSYRYKQVYTKFGEWFKFQVESKPMQAEKLVSAYRENFDFMKLLNYDVFEQPKGRKLVDYLIAHPEVLK